MAKQLNVNMNFTANTKQAESSIAQLKQSLSSIASTPIGTQSLNSGLGKAVTSAKELQTHLGKAFNVKTGNLDLNKFQASLTKSGTSLSALSKNLLSAGSAGEKAFMNLASSITSANTQLTKGNGLLSQFATTLANTARWQLSSTILHGFMSSISQAYSYAKQLNSSLTAIQVVTKDSTSQMKDFAVQANEAAKALSTTTTAYTDAALIFYQQGLTGSDVTDRTDVVMKMANVTGDSADEVSSYMTAIWNNFDNGSESLESFADKITALGATTASSSKEIAEGLQEFASIGDTVGLSYDYATSALATIVANTRESASTVGTSLKTIFSRLEGIKFDGSTDVDGDTTLNKYSEGLAEVGVNVLDTNGKLKDADEILSDLGEKWSTLDKNEKNAVAQTVAGTRQYTRLIALMDNWGDFQKNLNTTANSEGELQEQQDIYEQSWTAAANRVKTAWQEIYSEVFDDQAFIKLTNGFGKFVEEIDTAVDTLGGMKGVFGALALIMQKQFGQNIALSLTNMTDKMIAFGGQIKKASSESDGLGLKIKNVVQTLINGPNTAATLVKEMSKVASEAQQSSDAFSTFAKNLQTVNELTSNLQRNSKYLTDSQYQYAQSEIAAVQALGEEVALSKDATTSAYQRIDAMKEAAVIAQMNRGISGESSIANSVALSKEELAILKDKYAIQLQSVDADEIQFEKDYSAQLILEETMSSYASICILIDTINQLKQNGDNLDETNRKILSERINLLKEQGVITEEITEESLLQCKSYEEILQLLEGDAKAALKLLSALKTDKDIILDIKKSAGDVTKNLSDWQSKAAQFEQKIIDAKNATNAMKTGTGAFFTTLSKGVSAAGSLAMGLQMAKNAIDTCKDSSASFLDKLVSVTMAASMLGSGIGASVTTITTAIDAIAAAREANAAAAAKENAAIISSNATKAVENVMNKVGRADLRKAVSLKGVETDEEIANTLAHQSGITTEEAEIIVRNLAAGMTEKQAIASAKDAIAKEQERLAIERLKGSMMVLNPVMVVGAALALTLAGNLLLLYKYANQANETLEHTSEALSEAKDNYDTITSSVEGLNSAFDTFKDNKDTFKDLKTGTDEWKAALDDVNESAKETIDNYNELAEAHNMDDLVYGEDYDYDLNGAIEFTDEGKAKIESIESIIVNKASQVVTSADWENREAQEDVNKHDTLKGDAGILNRKYEYGENAAYSYQGKKAALDEQSYDAMMQAIANGEIDLENATIEEIGNILDTYTDLDLQDEVDQEQLIFSNDELKQTLIDNANVVKENTSAILGNITNDLNNNDKINEMVYGEDSTIDEDYRAGTVEAMAKDTEIRRNNLVEEYNQEGGGEDGWNRVQTMQDYAEAKGLKTEKTATGGLKIVDENGDKKNISDDDLKKWKAYVEAEKETVKARKQYNDLWKDSEKDNDALEKINKTWKDQKKVIKAAHKEVSDKKSWDEYKESNKKAAKQIEKYADTIKDDLGEALDITSDDMKDSIIDGEFVAENADLIEKALDGDEDALGKLQQKAAQKVMLGIDTDEMSDSMKSAYDEVNDFINTSKFQDFEIGTTLDDTGMRSKFNELIRSGKVSAEEISAALEAIGYEPEIGYKKIWIDQGAASDDSSTIQKEVNAHLPTYEVNDDSVEMKYEDLKGTYKIHTQAKGKNAGKHFIKVPYIKGSSKKTSNGNIDTGGGTTNNSDANPSSSPSSDSGSRGSGSSRTRRGRKTRLTRKSDMVDRDRKKTNAELDKLNKALDRAQKNADRLVGNHRVNQLKKINSILAQTVNKNQQILNQQKEYLKEDKKAVKNSLEGKNNSYSVVSEFAEAQNAIYGKKKNRKKTLSNQLQVKYDEEGYITNQYAIENTLYKKYHSLELAYNKDKNRTESDKQKLEDAKTAYEDFKSAMDQYNDTLDQIKDKEDEIQQGIYDWQDANYEAWQYKWEVRATISENNMKRFEYMFDNFSKNIYKTADAYKEIFSVDEKGNVNENSEIGQVMTDINNLYTKKEELMEAYSLAQISEQEYQEGLQDIYDKSYELLENLDSYMEQIEEMYSNFLESANDKVTAQLDKFSNITSQLNHMSTINDLLGYGKDYDRVLQIKQATKDVLDQEVQAQIAWTNQLATISAQADSDLAKAKSEVSARLLEEQKTSIANSGKSTAYEAAETKVDNAKASVVSSSETYSNFYNSVLQRLQDAQESTKVDLDKVTSQYNDKVEESEALKKQDAEAKKAKKSGSGIGNATATTTLGNASSSSTSTSKLKSQKDELQKAYDEITSEIEKTQNASTQIGNATETQYLYNTMMMEKFSKGDLNYLSYDTNGVLHGSSESQKKADNYAKNYTEDKDYEANKDYQAWLKTDSAEQAKKDFAAWQKTVTDAAAEADKVLTTEAQKMSTTVASAADIAGDEAVITAQNSADTAYNLYQEALDESYSSIEEYLEAVEDIFNTYMDKIDQDFADKITAMTEEGAAFGFDYILNSISNLKTNQDELLTSTNKLYETNKMLKDISTEINATDNASAKKRLSNFATEIKNLQSKTEVSQLDLDIAQKEYDLLKAQIALEEAQNAKSTVRLTRDDEGNYGYVYTADQDAVASAEQDVADKENELYNTRLNAVNDYGEKIIQTSNDWEQAVSDLHKQCYEDRTITEEEYQKKLAEINEEYGDRMKIYYANYTTAVGNNTTLISESYMSTYKDIIVRAATETATAVTEATKQMTDQIDEANDSREKAEDVVQTTSESTEEANADVTESYKLTAKSVKDLTTESSTLESEITNNLIPALDNESKSVYALQQEYLNLATAVSAAKEQLQGIADDTEEEEDNILEHEGTNYETIMKAKQTYLSKNASANGSFISFATNENTGLQYYSTSTDSQEKANEQAQGYADDATATKAAATFTEEYVATRIADLLDDGYQYGVSILYKTDKYGIMHFAADRTMSKDELTEELNKKVKKSESYSTAKKALNAAKETWNKIDLTKIRFFDTGGYTGSWGSEGRLAMLHEKELVLNKDDTENILSSVGILRDILGSLDMNAKFASLGLGQLESAQANVEIGGDTLDQSVTITAEFPNATNHSEIEEAFTNLINKASQYANRK